MSDTVKLIIEINKEDYEEVRDYGINMFPTVAQAIRNGTPLDSNSERAEVQAYFDGEAYGWEQGRKALIDDIKAEIEEYKSRQLTLAIGVDDLEKGKQIALEYVLAIFDHIFDESEDKRGGGK